MRHILNFLILDTPTLTGKLCGDRHTGLITAHSVLWHLNCLLSYSKQEEKWHSQDSRHKIAAHLLLLLTAVS